MDRFLNLLSGALAAPGRIVAWLLLPMVLFVCVAVFAAAARLNGFFTWETDIFLLGTEIGPTSVTDAQWHIFGLLVMLGGGWTYLENRHVRVEVLSEHMPRKARAVVEILGIAIFLLPFCWLAANFGYRFALSSFSTGEGSSYGGLQDRWVLKASLPVGFILLALAGLVILVREVRELFARRKDH
ncbi:TRAP transporter small permease subunit [Sinisalibacter aestuarii]|uniref:TRAP transporter small permease protein n=1 Tax=Sinisalibacter aestuarii TaxID=2949426 RepID=A0ABQ5LRX6_9RHOB|nr:TRAP transporter small permease subunit [Sinisalibacter aestuarii]GKY87750.1 hypothetical protein STA1M1_16190 [Sinisalibacter aestuarii]